jgi:hypothetical protein
VLVENFIMREILSCRGGRGNSAGEGGFAAMHEDFAPDDLYPLV